MKSPQKTASEISVLGAFSVAPNVSPFIIFPLPCSHPTTFHLAWNRCIKKLHITHVHESLHCRLPLFSWQSPQYAAQPHALSVDGNPRPTIQPIPNLIERVNGERDETILRPDSLGTASYGVTGVSFVETARPPRCYRPSRQPIRVGFENLECSVEDSISVWSISVISARDPGSTRDGWKRLLRHRARPRQFDFLPRG